MEEHEGGEKKMMKRMLLKLIGSFSHKIYHHVCKYRSNCQQEQVSTQHLGMMQKKIREKKKTIIKTPGVI